MDGFEATAQIRRKEESLGGRIPIVGLTSNAMKGDRERCLDAGMDDHIAKPVRIEKLIKAVETYGRRRFADNSAPETREDRDDVFDRAEVLERVGGDREFFNELVALFRTDCRKLLSETREAVSRKGCKALEMAAHTLKGSVSNFGAKDAFEAAHKLETIAVSRNWIAAEESCAELEKEIERLEPSLVALGTEEPSQDSGGKD